MRSGATQLHAVRCNQTRCNHGNECNAMQFNALIAIVLQPNRRYATTMQQAIALQRNTTALRFNSIALQCSSCIQLPCNASNCIQLRCSASDCIQLTFNASYCIKMRCNASNVLQCIDSHCNKMQYAMEMRDFSRAP